MNQVTEELKSKITRITEESEDRTKYTKPIDELSTFKIRRCQSTYENVGVLWSAYFRESKQNAAWGNIPMNALSAEDVATMLALYKIAEIATHEKTQDETDSLVDALKYLVLANEM